MLQVRQLVITPCEEPRPTDLCFNLDGLPLLTSKIIVSVKQQHMLAVAPFEPFVTTDASISQYYSMPRISHTVRTIELPEIPLDTSTPPDLDTTIRFDGYDDHQLVHAQSDGARIVSLEFMTPKLEGVPSEELAAAVVQAVNMALSGVEPAIERTCCPAPQHAVTRTRAVKRKTQKSGASLTSSADDLGSSFTSIKSDASVLVSPDALPASAVVEAASITAAAVAAAAASAVPTRSSGVFSRLNHGSLNRMRNFLIVYNPISGRGKGREIVQELVTPPLSEAGLSFEVMPTTHRGHASERASSLGKIIHG